MTGQGDYQAGSLSLPAVIAMGTGVMIGAGIFALTGQIAELAGAWYPLAFVLAAAVSGFSAYSYVQLSAAYPSAGGIAMYLSKAYGRSVITGGCALLMALSMVINESLVARTFGTYALQPFGLPEDSALVPWLGVGLIAFAFAVNVATNRWISTISMVAAVAKVGGILLFAGITLWYADFGYRPFEAATTGEGDPGPASFMAAVALGILAYKGFTTITNSGDEVENPERNVGRAIIVSLVLCLVVSLAVAWAVGSTLSIDEIIAARDYSLAEASRPVLGQYGLWLTVGVAIIATASGLLASVFAVSRMLAMLTKMELVPHRHFGMPGRIQLHTLVYTVVIASILTLLFDLARIASLGAIFYLVMDIAIHWGLLRHLREDTGARPAIIVAAIVLDAIALLAFLWMKLDSDPMIVWIGLGGVAAVFAFTAVFLRLHGEARGDDPNYNLPNSSANPPTKQERGGDS